MMREDTSEHILNVAASLFVANGARYAAVLQICAAAGASVSVANCRFRTKARLYADVVRSLVDRFVSYFSGPAAETPAVCIFSWRELRRTDDAAMSLPLRDAGYDALLAATVDDAWALMARASEGGRRKPSVPLGFCGRPRAAVLSRRRRLAGDAVDRSTTYGQRHPAPTCGGRVKEHHGDTSTWHGQLSAAEGRHERRHREVAGHDGRVDLLAHGHPLPACRDGR